MKRDGSDKIMAPLWLMYPHIPQGSIGWRMGYGENYGEAFFSWFSALKREEKADYEGRFPKPICWDLMESRILRRGSFWIYKWRQDGQPAYSLDMICEEEEADIHREPIFFWGHRPPHSGRVGKECLSQWYPADFNVGHITYRCMEQYMMSKKALLFGDEETNRKIMASREPGEIKELGRSVKGFQEEIWESFRLPIVLTGNYYKFSQLPALRTFLLETGESLLVEASPYDTVWGIGINAARASACPIRCWPGKNLLGFSLMEVRDELNRLWRNAGQIDFPALHSEFD